VTTRAIITFGTTSKFSTTYSTFLRTPKKNGYEPEARLVLCEPRYLHPLDGSEWEDDLADEGELSDEVGAAIDALNAVLRLKDRPVGILASRGLMWTLSGRN